MLRTISEVMHTDIPSLTIVRIISREEVEFRADCNITNVARVIRINFKVTPIGPNPSHSTTTQSHHFAISSLCRFHPEIADCNVKPSVNTHPAPICGMIGAARMP
ncbi:hypothetical protein N8595_03200 [bacterium]|nr:hypothetical protein [bacterium]